MVCLVESRMYAMVHAAVPDAVNAIDRTSRFSQAADENAVSRIYIGIHFRRAVEEGVRHGRTIAEYAVHQFMKPVR